MADHITSSAFTGRIGERFAARATDGTPVELTLTRCDETPYGDPTQWRDSVGRVPFSIEFTTTSEHAVGQGIFGFEELGDVFMTPVGRDGDVLRYEAVFS